jgi:hypothetical protein
LDVLIVTKVGFGMRVANCGFDSWTSGLIDILTFSLEFVACNFVAIAGILCGFLNRNLATQTRKNVTFQFFINPHVI